MGYIDDTESVESIEAKFQMLDTKLENGKGTVEEIARSVFVETVDPTQVPLDVWYDLENYGNEKFIEDDDFEPDFYDGDEEIPRMRSLSRSRSKSSGMDAPGSNFASFTQIDQLGSGIELWPDYKLRQVESDANNAMIHVDFPNTQYGLTRENFISLCQRCPINFVEQMTPSAITKIAGNTIDAILMDIPFGKNNWNFDRFISFIRELRDTIVQSFFVIWSDPENLTDVVTACTRLDLKFCDSISAELLNPLGYPLQIPLSNGFNRQSRMLVMYRTDDISRNDLAQQRIKDTGWGIAAQGGKTYDRYSMPMVAHQILETMLPPRAKSSKSRVFVELWPSFFNRRDGWTFISEYEQINNNNTLNLKPSKKFK